jgi:Rod binding domain-containing protein
MDRLLAGDTILAAARAAQPVPAPRTSGATTPDAALRTGRNFEQMFLAQMLTPIFDTLPTDGAFGGGHAEQMMRSFQVDSYADAIMRSGGIGLAQNIAMEILRLQETAHG